MAFWGWEESVLEGQKGEGIVWDRREGDGIGGGRAQHNLTSFTDLGDLHELLRFSSAKYLVQI